MAVARTNPLKPGVYWIDVWAPSPAKPKWPNGRPIMQRWVDANAITVIATVDREVLPSGTLDPRPGANPLPYRDFWKFQVLSSPTPFPFKELGFPEIRKLAAPAQVTAADTAFHSDDVVQKPPPEPLFDWSGALGLVPEDVKKIAIIAALAYLFKESK